MSKNLKFDSLDTDGTLTSDSDKLVSSQKAIKTYIDNKVSEIESSVSMVTATITKSLSYTNQVDVSTPTSSGVTGQIVFGTSSIFVCTATNTWIKADLSW